METLYPATAESKHFVSAYITPWQKKLSGYKTIVDLEFQFEDLKVPDFRDDRNRFEFKTTDQKTIISIKSGMYYDGATCAIDYHTRLLFALVHDVACWATEQSKNHLYRDALNELAYEIVTIQGGYWFNGLLVEHAVKQYSKMLKKKGLFVG